MYFMYTESYHLFSFTRSIHVGFKNLYICTIVGLLFFYVQ